MKSSNKYQIEVNTMFFYWKVLSINKSNAKCICTGCNHIIKDISILKLIEGKAKSCGCMNNVIRRQAAQAKYGVDNVSQAKQIKQKKVETTKKNFGVDHPMQSKEIMDKSKATVKQKYDVDHISQLDSIKEIKKASFVLNTPELKERIRQQCLKEHGVDNYLKATKVREQIKQILKDKYNVDNPSQSKLIKQKKQQTSLSNYGVLHPQQSSYFKNIKGHKIERVEDCKQYVSISEAARDMKGYVGEIRKALKDPDKVYKGFHWKYV